MPKASKQKPQIGKDTTDQTNIINSFKELVESDRIQEFVLYGIDSDGQIIVASYCSDIYTGIGLTEMGKLAYMNQQVNGEE